MREALLHLDRGPATLLAGGTDFFPRLGAGDLNQPTAGTIPDTLLDITRLKELRGLTQEGTCWRIGATTTWADIATAALPAAFDGLKQAALEVGSVQIQNRATIAGNICNASPAADGVPPLLSLDAAVELISQGGTRMLPLAEFITDVRQTALAAGEMVRALHIPTPPPQARGAFVKLGSRIHLVISIAMVAAYVQVQGDNLTQVRLAVGSCSAVAQRLRVLENHLTGMPVAALAALPMEEAAFWEPLSPISDVRGAADYRRAVLAPLCRRALMRACTGSPA